MSASQSEINWLLKEKYHGIQTPEFFTDRERLASGEPLAYVIGFVPFASVTIWLDSKPLIPRVETEFWTLECLKNASPLKKPQPKILDLCAGSGCVGVALAHALPEAHITFAEIDPAHESTIKKNCAQNSIAASRYRIVIGDLFSPVSQTDTFDLIVSNPPYIDQTLLRTADSVHNFEPHTALYSEDSGLAHIKTIIEKAVTYLKPHGELWLEHEPEQVRKITELARAHFRVNTHLDQYGVVRFTQLVLQ